MMPMWCWCEIDVILMWYCLNIDVILMSYRCDTAVKRWADMLTCVVMSLWCCCAIVLLCVTDVILTWYWRDTDMLSLWHSIIVWNNEMFVWRVMRYRYDVDAMSVYYWCYTDHILMWLVKLLFDVWSDIVVILMCFSIDATPMWYRCDTVVNDMLGCCFDVLKMCGWRDTGVILLW